LSSSARTERSSESAADAIRARIADLQAAHDLLDHGVRCRADDVTACPNFQQTLNTTTVTTRHPGQT
jgi:hypothetical protein